MTVLAKQSEDRGPSPAFRFYPSDFLGSPDVQIMDLHEVGAYMLLLCWAWQSENHGYLPDDDTKLRKYARMTTDQWNESRDALLRKFPIANPGWRCNLRMVREAKKQADYSESQRSKANKRWGKENHAAAHPVASNAHAPALPSASVSDSAFVSASDSISGSEFKEREGEQQTTDSLSIPSQASKNSGVSAEAETRTTGREDSLVRRLAEISGGVVVMNANERRKLYEQMNRDGYDPSEVEAVFQIWFDENECNDYLMNRAAGEFLERLDALIHLHRRKCISGDLGGRSQK